jgi:hypothetical protein
LTICSVVSSQTLLDIFLRNVRHSRVTDICEEGKEGPLGGVVSSWEEDITPLKKNSGHSVGMEKSRLNAPSTAQLEGKVTGRSSNQIFDQNQDQIKQNDTCVIPHSNAILWEIGPNLVDLHVWQLRDLAQTQEATLDPDQHAGALWTLD